MVDNFAESASIQALFHSTELTGVEPQPQRQEISSADGDKVINHQQHGDNLPVLDLLLADAQSLPHAFSSNLVREGRFFLDQFSFHFIVNSGKAPPSGARGFASGNH